MMHRALTLVLLAAGLRGELIAVSLSKQLYIPGKLSEK